MPVNPFRDTLATWAGDGGFVINIGRAQTNMETASAVKLLVIEPIRRGIKHEWPVGVLSYGWIFSKRMASCARVVGKRILASLQLIMLVDGARITNAQRARHVLAEMPFVWKYVARDFQQHFKFCAGIVIVASITMASAI